MKMPFSEVKALVEEAGELAEDESVQLHHCKEGRGNDRCYVTRRSDATLVYCFHCSGSGCVVDKFSKVKGAKSGGSKTKKTTHFSRPPSDADRDISRWSVGALGWIGKASLTTKEAVDYGMSYSPTAQRVFLPLYNDGKMVGCLARKIEADGPKYLLSKQGEFLFHIDKGGDTCVVVEDILSAIRIGRQCSVVALLGTALSDLQVKALSKYKEVVVWLDNDNPIVKMKQVKAKRRMEVYCTTSILKTDKDPKEYTDGEIKDLLS